MEKIKEKIFQSNEFKEAGQLAKGLAAGQSIVLRGVAGSLLSFVTVQIAEERQTQVLLVASDEEKAEKLRDDCALLLGEANVRLFGTRPTHQAQMLDMTSSIAQIETLKALSAGVKCVVIASPQSIIEKVPIPGQFSQTIIEINVNQEHKFQKLIERLEELGFERKEFVGSYGDFAVRGGIIDVFPYVGENPLRLEFWGDTVESIREFDVLSQRSIRELQSASIIPSLTKDRADAGAHDRDDGDENRITTVSLFDYLQNDALIVFDEPAIIEKEINELADGGEKKALTYEDFSRRAAEFPMVVNSLFTGEKSAIDFQSSHQPSFNGSIDTLLDALAKLSRDGYIIYLTSDTNEESKRLRELIEEVITAPEEELSLDHRTANQENEINTRHLTTEIHPEFFAETIHSGFLFPAGRIAVFTEHEIFGRLKRRGTTRRRRFKGFSQKELQQLQRGDYVVHIDHGIGTFGGLSKIKVGGIEQEVMKLFFLENDMLYVNLSFINRVQKYSSQEGHIPKLNKLGAADWERTKARAKRRIKDIARDIIALYAKRKLEKGFTFSPDTHWQKELEASFMYEDTIDQATATIDVKGDMESSSPMDRLICGDVGFGKTEVALRAAFKAVMDGKQVVLLVPTTILAIQHYNTFKDRLSRYTTRVEHITRFKSTKEQKQIVNDLAKGSIDIIIGTHRLLSKDIAVKDLGLLIIDEEHRFGVAAKEKLRQLKATVDTLTLTATPIPRTLHFSLIGARDLSLITTPPRNRLPIQTEIISADASGRQLQWQVIREAIIRELHRSGQIYFVHDRVNNIDAIADQVRAKVPEAKVHIAHGQMTGHQLEKTMLEFMEKKYDVLVCTKIIESGLDIPNVNTIIINRADRFGLAELYQLRGRVGRSNIQAYAYFITPPLSAMPKQTLRRLQAIEEFTELGSGFNLAMRDLEIRGAGNLLGGEQSGYIMEMGFEMYERIVQEAVAELKQEEFTETFAAKSPAGDVRNRQSAEAVIESDVEALIPDFYIESDTERLDIYRRLYKATSAEDVGSIREELKDRFGEYPEEVESLLDLIDLRQIATRAGFQKVELKGDSLIITLPDKSNTRFYGDHDDPTSPFQQMMKTIAGEVKKDMQLQQSDDILKLRFNQPQSDGTKNRLGEAKRCLESISTQLLHC